MNEQGLVKSISLPMQLEASCLVKSYWTADHEGLEYVSMASHESLRSHKRQLWSRAHACRHRRWPRGDLG